LRESHADPLSFWSAFGPHDEDFSKLLHSRFALLLGVQDQIMTASNRGIAVAEYGFGDFNVNPGVEKDANEPTAERLPAAPAVNEHWFDFASTQVIEVE
jgi:hypothetical protein